MICGDLRFSGRPILQCFAYYLFYGNVTDNGGCICLVGRYIGFDSVRPYKYRNVNIFNDEVYILCIVCSFSYDKMLPWLACRGLTRGGVSIVDQWMANDPPHPWGGRQIAPGIFLTLHSV